VSRFGIEILIGHQHELGEVEQLRGFTAASTPETSFANELTRYINFDLSPRETNQLDLARDPATQTGNFRATLNVERV
jgi:hypothetical protein